MSRVHVKSLESGFELALNVNDLLGSPFIRISFMKSVDVLPHEWIVLLAEACSALSSFQGERQHDIRRADVFATQKAAPIGRRLQLTLEKVVMSLEICRQEARFYLARHSIGNWFDEEGNRGRPNSYNL